MSIDIDAIEARANAATPGPWGADYAYDEKDKTVYSGDAPGDDGYWIATMVGGYENTENDVAFIAAARQDVPALCAEVRELRAALERARALAETWRNKAAGDYCQTYNKGMAQGLEIAADELAALLATGSGGAAQENK